MNGWQEQESLTMPSGVRIVEYRHPQNAQQYMTVARWPADEHGDIFAMVWPFAADMFHDTPFGEEFLTSERARAERGRNTLWCDWDGAFA